MCGVYFGFVNEKPQKVEAKPKGKTSEGAWARLDDGRQLTFVNSIAALNLEGVDAAAAAALVDAPHWQDWVR